MIYKKKCIKCGKEMFRKKKSEADRKNWKFCSRGCATSSNNIRRKLPIILKSCEYCNKEFPVRKKRELNYRFCSKRCFLIFMNKSVWHKLLVPKGKNHYAWTGGINRKLQKTPEWSIWRKQIFERDNWTCQKCGIVGGKLHPHHIKEISKYPELIYNLNNGQTLCIECHKKTDNYGAYARTKIRNQYMKVAINI